MTLTTRVYNGMSANKEPRLTPEEWECVRVCVANAPIPYDITKKKIPGDILEKIGHPTKVEHEGELKIECDLSVYE
tara:strand:- start:236 stop:463 length:228 start_codon:yes stop_codon:yes gene_type:complete